jgi:hypothetical protein
VYNLEINKLESLTVKELIKLLKMYNPYSHVDAIVSITSCKAQMNGVSYDWK